MKQENPYLEVPSFPESNDIDLYDFLDAPNRPIEIEIGFGKGHFLMQRASAVTEAVVLGIETRRKWVDLVRGRIHKWHKKNAVVYHGNAREVFPRLVPEASVERIFVNFPDPWWKARHEKRMVICPELLNEAGRLLKDNGDFFVQTDVDFRAEHYQSLLANAKDFVPSSSDGFIEQNPFSAYSLRETKAEQIDLPVFRLLFKRKPR